MYDRLTRWDGAAGFLLLGGLAILSATAGLLTTIDVASKGLLMVAAALLVATLFVAITKVYKSFLMRSERRFLGDFLETEETACFVASAKGRILFANSKALEMSGSRKPEHVLRRFFASPEATVLRLQSRAEQDPVEETVTTRSGMMRFKVTRCGAEQFIWRLDEGDEPSEKGTALGLPALTASPTGTILFMNMALRKLTGTRIKTLDQLFQGQRPISGRSYEIMTADGPLRTLVATVEAIGNRQEIYLLPGNAVSVPEVANWDTIEDLPVPLMKIARTGEVIAANREARALIGVPMDDNTRLSDLLEGLGRPVIDWLDDVVYNRTANTREFLRGRGDRQDFFVQVALHPSGSGDDRHLIAVLNDMTEFKSLEAQFVQSQKMQAIGQLAGGVAHDFNNLLTAITGHCDLLLLRHPKGSDHDDLIEISRNAQRAAGLVAQLLAFSRKQTLSPELLDLRSVTKELTGLLDRLVGERIRIEYRHDPDVGAVRADKRQFEQVVMNLVVNARDAMPTGGLIRIDCENIVLTEPVRRDRATLPAGRYVLVKVIDEGQGIAPEKLTKIFEPFYTTKRVGEGTGLGLSTAYGIVKQTGGYIFVDSEVDVGSVFSLYFPCVAGDVVSDVESEPEASPGSPRKSAVLLVEDETPVRTFAARALRMQGLDVFEADCGEAALAILEDRSLEIDLFMSDVVMPGMDGPTWVTQALNARPDTPVVFMSGYAEDAFGEKKARISGAQFLPKPFSLSDLTETVTTLVGTTG